jgi:hypothetical protein
MLKNILKLEGAQKLTKNEQNNINGGIAFVCCEWCADGSCLDWTSSGAVCAISIGCLN